MRISASQLRWHDVALDHCAHSSVRHSSSSLNHTPKDAFMEASPSTVSLDTSPRSPTAPYPWPPQPEEQRSRAPEFYGFVAWTSTYLLFVLYLLWAILPDAWIVRTGVTWYPNRCVCVCAHAHTPLTDLMYTESGRCSSPRGA